MGGVLVTGARLPWWRRRRVAHALPPPPAPHGRYRWVYDTRGPKVRLGIVWFALVLGAARLGAVALALVYGLAGTVAALQAAYAWRRARPPRPHRLAAAAVAFAMAAASPLGLASVAVALAIGVGLAVAFPGAVKRPPPGRVAAAGPHVPHAGLGAALATLRCGAPVGAAAAAPALVAGAGAEAVLVLVLLVSAYEAGDYLVGSGAANLVEGPVAGGIGVLALSFAASLVEPHPFSPAGTVLMGALTALCCPLGQVLGSAVLPRGNVHAPALRRIDSLLVTGPAWVAALALSHHVP